MKKRFFVVAALLGAAVATADSSAVCKPEAKPADEVSLAAGATAITNGKIALEYAGGVVKITAPGIETPVATIQVNLKPETLGTSVLSNPARKFQMLSLRGPDGSIAFKLEDGEARFAIAYARNAAPVTVKWNAAAVVVPDIFAEDEVLLPGQSERALPPFAPLYLALLNDGDATLACIPVKAKSPALLSGDLKTLTLSSKNNEDYIFVLETGRGAWHRTLLPEKPGEFKTVDDWEPPFPAL